MNKKIIGYWISTGLFCVAMGFGGLFDVLLSDEVRTIMNHLGYPDYFTRLLGVWKILGIAALLVPGMPVLKEWAYAGFTFDLTGAFASHLATGDGIQEAIPPIIILMFAVASYYLRPTNRKPPVRTSVD